MSIHPSQLVTASPRLLLQLMWLITTCATAADAGRIARHPLSVSTNAKSGFTLLPSAQTGVNFTNTLEELVSAENRVLNNGSGVAAGDIDNDGLPDLFFCSLNNQNRLYKNLGNWHFTEITAQAGLTFPPGYYRAAIFADVNGDGSLDLLVGTVGQGLLCFLNTGGGRFTNFTTQAGITTAYATESVALADIDGNGTLDLYVANNRTDDIRDWPRIPVMFVNKKPTVPPHLRDRITLETGQVQEFGEPHILYVNDGAARFTALSWTNGTFLNEQGQPLAKAPLDWGLTAAFRDLNNDGLPDLYVCNDYWTPDRIWLNQGNGSFRAIDALAIRKICASSMGVDFADINHDGHLDIFAVDMLSRSPELRKRQIIAKRVIPPRIGDIDTRVQGPQNTLLLNRGDGTYAEIAFLAGVHASDWAWSPVFVDVDLDGHDDLLITAGHIRDIQDLDATEKIRKLPDTWRRNPEGPELVRAFTEAKRQHTRFYPYLNMPVVAFRNLGNLRFQEVTKEWGLDHHSVNHGIALADFDGDGDLDAAVNRLGAAAGIFRNESGAPRVAVRVLGNPPNTQAIGARIELLGGPVPNHQTEVVCAGSYLSGSDTLRVFGTGSSKSDVPLHLRVTWRDGRKTEVSDVRPNHLYEIREDHAPIGPAFRQLSTNNSQLTALFQDVTHLLQHTHYEEPFNDFERQPLLPRKLSQNGPGVTWFDLNGDSFDDLVVGSGKGGQMAIFINKNGKSFERFGGPTVDAKIPRDQGTIVAYRGERTTKLVAALSTYEPGDTNAACVSQFSFSPPSTLKLEPPTIPALPASAGPVALADIDSDGDLDLFIGGQIIPGRYPEPASSLLYRWSNGEWRPDITNSAALSRVGLVSSALWSDLTGDGFPELVLACEWGPIRVFSNERGQLRDATTNLGLAQFAGFWMSVATGDFDEDGSPDILAGNWGFNSHHLTPTSQPVTLFYGDLAEFNRIDIVETEFDPVRKQFAPRLLRDELGAGLPFVLQSFPTHEAYSRATISDVLGNHITRARQMSANTLATTLFLNRQGRFERRELPIETQFSPAMGVQVADFDGDGHEDAFLSENFFAFAREESRLDAGRGLLLRGDGRGNLEPVAGQLSGLKIYGEQRGAAVTDFDKDGRVDLVVSQNGAATRLYRNSGARPGLRVRLKGKGDNIDAIGAAVRLHCGNKLGPLREVQAGSGCWSQNSFVQALGYPSAADRESSANKLWVRWPGGQTKEVVIPAGAAEITVQADH